MTDECFEIEDLEEVIAAEKRGERPAHLDTCPRCRALLASCRAFLEPPDHPAGSRVKEAAERLLLHAIPGFAETHSGRTGSRQTGHRRPPFQLNARWLRPVWGLAAVALLVVVVRQVGWNPATNEPSHVMRAAEPQDARATMLLAPRPGADGTTVLLWRGTPGAEAYRVAFYRADLSLIDQRTVAGDTAITVTRDEAAALASKGVLYWRVRAMEYGQEISHSAPREIHFPGH